MCGIAGVIDLKKSGRVRKDYLENMIASLRHRGPDENGSFVSPDKNKALANTRLSIIDLKSGRQPVFNKEGTVCVVLNGEIYNYKELRNNLLAKGYKFTTHSDTETIAHLYEEKGRDFVKYLDGMFAILLWDFKREKAYLCRDRLGKKPLYYYKDNNWLVIASELTAILKCGIGDLNFKTDPDSVYQFFSFGMTAGKRSIIENIKKVPAAGILDFDYRNNKIQEARYWEIPRLEHGKGYDFEKVVEEFGDLFEDAVKKRFVADVKVGAFLSGGIDSTAVVATAKEIGYDLDTYTIGFRETGFDESAYAKEVAGILNIKNKTIVLDREITKLDVADIMSRFDEPFFDYSSIPTYFLSKMVSSDLKVVLSGDGGDESLMGYSHYDYYYKYPGHITRRMPSGAVNLLNRIKLSHWDKLSGDRFTRVHPSYLKRIFKSSVKNKPADIKNVLSKYINGDFLDVLSKIDMHLYLVDDILVKVDRMSMQNSLEVRSPLLDYKLVEYLAKIPSKIKMGYAQNKKAILKEYLKKRFKNYPDLFSVIDREKHGFRFPIGKYISELEGDIRQWLMDDGFISYFAFKKKVIEGIILDYFKRGNKKGSKSLWHLVCLYWWWNKNRDVLK